MQSELAKGDAIVTIGGLHGTIESVDETKIVIKSGGSHLTFDRNAIREVVKTIWKALHEICRAFLVTLL